LCIAQILWHSGRERPWIRAHSPHVGLRFSITPRPAPLAEPHQSAANASGARCRGVAILVHLPRLRSGSAISKDPVVVLGEVLLLEDLSVNRADFRVVLDPPLTSMTPLIVGQPRPGIGTPATHVTVEHDGSPVLRVDLFESEPAAHAFQEVLEWGDFVVIGFGAHVHLVSATARTSVTFALNGYFGHLYSVEDRLLVADAERLRCFDKNGSLVWSSGVLGIDGVVVHTIREGIIEVEGEWDPPGGWRLFRVHLCSGQVLRRGYASFEDA